MAAILSDRDHGRNRVGHPIEQLPRPRRDARLGETRGSEFDHRAARQRDVAGDAHGTAFGQMERGVLLVVDILAGRAVDRHDDLVAALCCARSRADRRPLERVAADDHGLDAGLFEGCLERGAQELVRAALAIPFAGARLDRGVHYVVGRRLAVRADQAVPDDHVVGTRFVVQPLEGRHRGDAARARGAAGFHNIEKQQRRGRRIDRDLFELRRRRRDRRAPVGNDVGDGRRSEQGDEQRSGGGSGEA